MWISGRSIITNSTFTNNSSVFRGGGIYANEGQMTLWNTIVAGNTATVGQPDVLKNNPAVVISDGNNLIGNTDTFSAISWQTTGATADILNQPARLAPLGFYGGATPTHALLSTSPAINAGTATGAPTTDQRGAARVGNLDIGAFELNSTQNGGSFVAVLPGGSTSQMYSQIIVPETGSTTYCLLESNLPPGLMGINNCTPPFAGETNIASPAAAITISGVPTTANTYNFSVTAVNGGDFNVTNYRLQILAPTAAGVSIGGRIFAEKGRGLANAIVYLTKPNGEVIQTRSSSFGYYRFDDIAAGQTVIISVISKRYQFAPQVVSVTEELTELNFAALE